jgi:hypothetical protein
MARPELTPAAAAAITISVVGSEQGPYAMFDVVTVTTSGATLRGPLLLELGERLTLRVSRGDKSVDVAARIGGMKRGDGHSEPTTDVVFEDGNASQLSPIVG